MKTLLHQSGARVRVVQYTEQTKRIGPTSIGFDFVGTNSILNRFVRPSRHGTRDILFHRIRLRM